MYTFANTRQRGSAYKPICRRNMISADRGEDAGGRHEIASQREKPLSFTLCRSNTSLDRVNCNSIRQRASCHHCCNAISKRHQIGTCCGLYHCQTKHDVGICCSRLVETRLLCTSSPPSHHQKAKLECEVDFPGILAMMAYRCRSIGPGINLDI